MKQRLGLAQATLGRPKLLIFDEPTGTGDAMYWLAYLVVLCALLYPALR